MKPTFNPKRAAVIGTGNMGVQIACMLANVNIHVLLLEKPGNGKNDSELLERANNRLSDAIEKVPPMLYDRSFASKIKTGLLNQHLEEITSTDWVIESISEDLEQKILLFKFIEKHIGDQTIITSNTSSISINSICNSFSDSLRKRFLGMHFFNPVRYLPVLEIIPGNDTEPGITDSINLFLDKTLGKNPVVCKDTPGFIANRIGIYNFLITLQAALEFGYSVEEIDRLTGRILGRPKIGILKPADHIGIDIILKVTHLIKDNTDDGYFENVSNAVGVLESMVQKNILGRKSGGGFYKKEKRSDNKLKTYVIDLESLIYNKPSSIKIKSISKARGYKDLAQRYQFLLSLPNREGDFYRKILLGIFDYVSNLTAELTSEIYKIDDLLKMVYGWDAGLFEIWQQMGIKDLSNQLKNNGFQLSGWIHDVNESDRNSFYSITNDETYYFDSSKSDFEKVPGMDEFILLDNLRDQHTVWNNKGASLIDLNDGVVNLEFHTKMNIIDADVIEGIQRSIDIAGNDFNALIIGNEGNHFSVGVNLGVLFMMAIEKDYRKINDVISMFQNIMLDIRYAPFPVISTPHGLTFGGGMEISLHCDRIHATTEAYMGLVEIKAGILPAGGGTKELTAKLSNDLDNENMREIAINLLETIIYGKASNAAFEAKKLGLMGPDDPITPNPRRLIKEAKHTALQLVSAGYSTPPKDRMIKVGGTGMLDFFQDHIEKLSSNKELSSYDTFIARDIARIMSGGDKGKSDLQVSEQYLLDLEREAFLSLTGRRETLDRIYKIIGRR
ncbi:3-hydroxyacyl-CoA dehydrogenase/enoyl-CoA hydratase family protein [Bacteroidota bacterium]